MSTHKELFTLYNDFLKPVYTEIEARGNTLPVELLFETHSALDHLCRTYSDEADQDKHIQKAMSHLKRGTLDAFKIKLKYYNKALNNFEKRKVDLTLIDNGSFFSQYSQLKTDIMKTAKNARLSEKTENINDAFEMWLQVAADIDKMEDEFFNSSKISWAKVKTFKIWSLQTGIGFLLGVIAGVFGNILTMHISQIHLPIKK